MRILKNFLEELRILKKILKIFSDGIFQGKFFQKIIKIISILYSYFSSKFLQLWGTIFLKKEYPSGYIWINNYN